MRRSLIIEENFGLIPSQETLCDFPSLSREPNEPYRQFYDRMVSFAIDVFEASFQGGPRKVVPNRFPEIFAPKARNFFFY